MRKIITNKAPQLIIMLIVIVLLSSCAHNIDMMTNLPVEPYGFFGGLWHGIIAPADFVFSLFPNSGVVMYATLNTGHWYDFGFITGIGILFIGGTNFGNSYTL